MIRLFFALALAVVTPRLAWACSSCGCTLSSDWEEASQTGVKLDLRYDYINQTRLWAGMNRITGPAAAARQNGDEAQEVEKYSTNNYVTATGEYSFTPSWKLSLAVPYIIRRHETLGQGSDGADPTTGDGAYQSSYAEFGDVKIFGRYQGLSEDHSLGLVFGAKLPTGRYNLAGQSTNPSAPGPVRIDRGLEPGTGTTDLILGAYLTRALDKNWDYFGEVLYQTALDEVSHYRPGDGLNVNAGFRFMGLSWLMPQLQLNARYVHHDTGTDSDTISTGGTLVYLSPGLVVPLDHLVEVYGFAQLPIYQYVEGVQLVPEYTASLGVRYSF